MCIRNEWRRGRCIVFHHYSKFLDPPLPTIRRYFYITSSRRRFSTSRLARLNLTSACTLGLTPTGNAIAVRLSSRGDRWQQTTVAENVDGDITASVERRRCTTANGVDGQLPRSGTRLTDSRGVAILRTEIVVMYILIWWTDVAILSRSPERTSRNS